MRHLVARAAPCALIPLALLMGCGGDKDDTDAPPAATCDDYDTSSLSSLDRDDWPDGVDEAVATYLGLAGRWRADDCGEEPVILRIAVPSQDALRVVFEAPATTAACGCTEDPAFGADNALQPVALIPEFEVYFEESDVDPGVDGRRLYGAGALFAPGSPVSLRVCGRRQIDPAEGSAYDDAVFHFRILEDGSLTATVSLLDVETGAPPVHCELTNVRP